MKALHTIISIFLLITGMAVSAQPQLSWRMNNPRILDSGGDQFLEFQIQVKSNTAEKFFTGMTVVMNFNGPGLSQIATDVALLPGSSYNFTNSLGHPAYNLSSNVTTDSYEITMVNDPGTSGNAAGANDFTQIDTTWQTWATVRIFILDASATAGLIFRNTGTGGFANGTYRDAGAVSNSNFLTPHLVDSKDLRNLYMGRIYSNAFGFTQFQSTLNWGVAVNTSIWDSAGVTSVPSALVNKLRIHGASPAPGTYQIASLSGGYFQILPNTGLTASDSTVVEQPGGLIIQSDATGQGQFLDKGITYLNGGTAQADAYFTQDQWHFYSPAVTVASYTPFYLRYMKYYNELDASNAGAVQGPYHSYKYIVLMDTTVLPAMTGYAMWSASSGTYASDPLVKPTGQLITGPASYTITRSPWIGQLPPFDGWNLIGNPYTTAIDLTSDSISWGNTEPSAWFWNPNTGNFEVYLVGGEGTKATPYAAPQQGFFVHHADIDPDPTTLTIRNGARTINMEPFLKQTGTDIIRIFASSLMNSYSDKAIVSFSETASTGYDPGIDAYKRMGDADAPQIYTVNQDGYNLTVNALPILTADPAVPLSFSAGPNGQYTLSFTYSGLTNKYIYLEDKLTQNWVSISDNYMFTHSASDLTDRFILHVVDNPLGVSSMNKSSVTVYSYNDQVYVINNSGLQGTLQLFDMTGRTVLERGLQPGKSQYQVAGGGMYTYRILTENEFSSGKLVIK